MLKLIVVQFLASSWAKYSSRLTTKTIERIMEGPAWRSLWDKVIGSGCCCLLLFIASKAIWASGFSESFYKFREDSLWAGKNDSWASWAQGLISCWVWRSLDRIHKWYECVGSRMIRRFSSLSHALLMVQVRCSWRLCQYTALILWICRQIGYNPQTTEK